MNKYTWMIIALALAIAAGFLIKDADQQPVIMQVVNYIRAPKTAEVVVPPVEVVAPTTGDVADEVAPTDGTVVADDTAKDVAVEVVADDAAEVVADDAAEEVAQ